MLIIDPSLPSIPAEVAQRYAEAGGALASRVSERLAHHPGLPAYLGGNPFRLLETNHRNHAAFMAEVLRTNNLALLVKTLPWVYHAYHNQGIAFDYFATELALWMEAIPERLPRADAELILPIYRWMARLHPETIQAAKVYTSDAPPIPLDLHLAYDSILERLLAGDHEAVLERARGLLDEGLSFPQLLQMIFFPAMVEVGTRWEQGRLSVAMEHQATAMTYRVLAALYYDQPFPSGMRGRALVASVTNEFHELGAWMVTTCLELDGWEITFLARDCPAEDLVQTALAERPAFVGLSVTMPLHIQAARETIAALRAALGPASTTKILVGGRAFMSDPGLFASVGADLFLPDCESIVEWARTLAGAA